MGKKRPLLKTDPLECNTITCGASDGEEAPPPQDRPPDFECNTITCGASDGEEGPPPQDRPPDFECNTITCGASDRKKRPLLKTDPLTSNAIRLLAVLLTGKKRPLLKIDLRTSNYSMQLTMHIFNIYLGIRNTAEPLGRNPKKVPDKRRRRRRPYDLGTKRTPLRLFEIRTDRVPSGESTNRDPVTQHTLNELSPSVRKLTFEPLQFDPGGVRGKYELVLNRKQWRAIVRTMHKRKDRKVLPANVPLPDGVNPNSAPSPASTLATTGKKVPRGSRLTPERLATMKIGNGSLSPAERQLFVDILFEHEAAIAFDESEMGLLDPSIEPPVVIHTIPHTPWQQQNLRLPKAMQDAATAHVKEKLAYGILELSQGPYRSRYFLVAKKKPDEYRFINDVQPLNKVTIRDSGMSPSVDEFSEDFAGYPITSTIDYFSGYYQIPLDKSCRDLTAFMSLLGLVRMTRLPQGWTNSVAEFMRIIGKVHYRQIPHEVRPFLDDVGIKGPKDRYGDEEISPGVRRFVSEHAQIFRRFMHDCWVAGLTISGSKSAIGMSGIEIVGFLCDQDGRRPEPRKIQRILDWPVPLCLKDARGFIGIVVYYRIFILDFAIIAAPIFALFRKGRLFLWTDECQLAMDTLKVKITEAPVLISLDFSISALLIVLHVDASTTIGWGAVMSQLQEDGRLYPARFESGIWSDAERKYDALKLECRALLKALKKFRFWLFGRYFSVQTDSQTLVWLLNQPPNDLPNAMITRWLIYIRLFDFDVKHIPGSQNGAADSLSRRGKGPEDESDDDPDDYFESQLYLCLAGVVQTIYSRISLRRGVYWRRSCSGSLFGDTRTT